MPKKEAKKKKLKFQMSKSLMILIKIIDTYFIQAYLKGRNTAH